MLGFHRITAEEHAKLEKMLAGMYAYPVSQNVIDQAVVLRQQKKMTLGDAIIAATRLVHGLTLVTRNTKDFDWIAGLTVHNPFDTKDEQA